ncbi:hypothetical protein EDEG_03826 [Edhazardia aedis USNM 41457]|uniref:PCI domain-containing protein n=1 Tax=Edhazardia aedis (strain USNM 41457) TaxID=1003232 RepID=J9DGA9_EDHAE|nr:hypothetical protein EDEG_03826 [Edhazardia aedis USNM 41457]|eukprot:EJW01630.1 hypothetical protein EDEG_03826 [Edhazardia aedis USNM 41457]
MDTLSILKSAKTQPEEKEEILHSFISRQPLSEISKILKDLPNLWPNVSIARTTKIIKKILKEIPQTEDTLHLINNLIDLYSTKKLLKLELECRKVSLLLNLKQYSQCFISISSLLKELKKHDDKVNQISLYVYESIANYEIRNYSKAKSALTSARALSVSTFCPSSLQAKIDKLSGMYLCLDKNYRTAYSYFLESIDSFLMEKMFFDAVIVARYLVLCGIVDGKKDLECVIRKVGEKIGTFKVTNEELTSYSKFISQNGNQKDNTSRTNFSCENLKNTSTMKHSILTDLLNDKIINILLKIEKCSKDRDLLQYNTILTQNKDLLQDDPFLITHLHVLYEKLLENNIIKILESYSSLKIDYVANKIGLTVDVVENKIRNMILDGSVNGIIDHVNRNYVLRKQVRRSEGDKELMDMIDLFIAFTEKM